MVVNLEHPCGTMNPKPIHKNTSLTSISQTKGSKLALSHAKAFVAQEWATNGNQPSKIKSNRWSSMNERRTFDMCSSSINEERRTNDELIWTNDERSSKIMTTLSSSWQGYKRKYSIYKRSSLTKRGYKSYTQFSTRPWEQWGSPLLSLALPRKPLNF